MKITVVSIFDGGKRVVTPVAVVATKDDKKSWIVYADTSLDTGVMLFKGTQGECNERVEDIIHFNAVFGECGYYDVDTRKFRELRPVMSNEVRISGQQEGYLRRGGDRLEGVPSHIRPHRQADSQPSEEE